MSNNMKRSKLGAIGEHLYQECCLSRAYQEKCEELRNMVDSDNGLPPKGKNREELIRDSLLQAIREPQKKSGWEKYLEKINGTQNEDGDNGIVRSLRNNFRHILDDPDAKGPFQNVRDRSKTPTEPMNSHIHCEVYDAFEQIEDFYQEDRSAFELTKMIFRLQPTVAQSTVQPSVQSQQQPVNEYYAGNYESQLVSSETGAMPSTSYFEGHVLIQSSPPESYHSQQQQFLSTSYTEPPTYPSAFPSETTNLSLNEIIASQQQQQYQSYVPNINYYSPPDTTYTTFQDFCSKFSSTNSQPMFTNNSMSSPNTYSSYPLQTYPITRNPIVSSNPTVLDFINIARPQTRYRYNNYTNTPPEPILQPIATSSPHQRPLQAGRLLTSAASEIAAMATKTMGQFGTSLRNIIATATDLLAVTGTAMDSTDYGSLISGLNRSSRFNGSSVRIR